MKRIYLLMLAALIGVAAKADWTFYVDVSNTNPKWTSVAVHCGNSSEWWAYFDGEQIADSDIYMITVKDWPDLQRIAFDQGTKHLVKPQDPYYGDFTVNATDENQKVVNGGLYVLGATTPTATVTPNYNPTDIETVAYYLGHEFAAGEGWQGELAMTESNGVYTAGPLTVTLPVGANFGVRKVTKTFHHVSDAWYGAEAGAAEITAPVTGYQLAEGSENNATIARGTWTFTLDPTNMTMSVSGEADTTSPFWGIHANLDGTGAQDYYFAKTDNGYELNNLMFNADGGNVTVFNNTSDEYGVASGTAEVSADATLTLVSGDTKQAVSFAKGAYSLALNPETMELTVTRIGSSLNAVAAPVMSPDSTAEYTAMPTVTITSATEGAIIYYTTIDTTANDATPFSRQTWTLYQGPFVPDGTDTTIKAIAVKDGMDDSDITEATYAISIVPIYMLMAPDGSYMDTPATTSRTLAAAFKYNLITDNVATFEVNSWTANKNFFVGLLDYTSAGGQWWVFSNGESLSNGTSYSLEPKTQLTKAPSFMTLPTTATDKKVSFKFNIKDNTLTASWDAQPTAIEEVEMDENVAPVYYTLQGVRVMNPENGIFIKVQGTEVTKVIL